MLVRDAAVRKRRGSSTAYAVAPADAPLAAGGVTRCLRSAS